jgi:hypothetical protein
MAGRAKTWPWRGERAGRGHGWHVGPRTRIKALRFAGRIRDLKGAGGRDDGDGVACGSESPIAGASDQGFAADISSSRSGTCARAAFHSADPSACRRRVLARPSDSRRSARQKAVDPQRYSGGMGVVAGLNARGRPADDVSRTPGTLSRRPVQSRSGPLLCLWAAGLSAGMALRSLGQGAEPKCRLARWLCHRMAALERPERFCAGTQTAADAAVRANGRAPLENGRGRSSNAAVSGLAGASEYPLAAASHFLGCSESASD